MNTLDEVKHVLDDVLALEGRARTFERPTPLLGELPEFDSIAVVSLVTQLQERFGITVHDEELMAETFQTVGSVAELVERKLAE